MSKLDWVGEHAVLGGRELGERVASRDPEYDHVWRECLFYEEVSKHLRKALVSRTYAEYEEKVVKNGSTDNETWGSAW